MGTFYLIIVIKTVFYFGIIIYNANTNVFAAAIENETFIENSEELLSEESIDIDFEFIEEDAGSTNKIKTSGQNDTNLHLTILPELSNSNKTVNDKHLQPKFVNTMKCCAKNCSLSQKMAHCEKMNCTCAPNVSVYINAFMMSRNFLTSIEDYAFSDYRFLKSVDLSNNLLETLSALAFANSTIANLNLNGNKLKSFPDFIFFPLKRLSRLSLASNSITHLNSKAFFENYLLDYINLAQNQLKVIPDFSINNTIAVCPNLTRLILNSNLLQNLDASMFKHIPKLTYLNLVSNSITKIDNQAFYYLKNLQFISLGKNRLDTMATNAFWSDSLTNISMFKTLFTFRKNTNYMGRVANLKSLDVSFTHISDCEIKEYYKFPFANTSLNNLLLRGTHLTEEKLEYLLKNQTQLEYLDISYNNIQSISSHILDQFSKTIRKFLMTDNKLTVVTSGTFPYELWKGRPQIQTFDFFANPFQCDCNIIWLRRWLKSNNSRVTDVNKYICDTPPSLRGTRVIDVKQPSDIECYSISVGDRIRMLFVCIFIGFVYVVVSVASLLHRFRWHARYVLFLYQIHRKKKPVHEERSYTYDAFVSYNIADRLFVTKHLTEFESKNNIRFCFHERDWMAGNLIMENIVESMISSRKVIILASNAFANSSWCEVELTLAQTRLFDLENDNVIILLLEELLTDNISPRLRLQLNRKTYIQWPGSEEVGGEAGVRLFWLQLKRALEEPSKPSTQINDEEIRRLVCSTDTQ